MDVHGAAVLGWWVLIALWITGGVVFVAGAFSKRSGPASSLAAVLVAVPVAVYGLARLDGTGDTRDLVILAAEGIAALALVVGCAVVAFGRPRVT